VSARLTIAAPALESVVLPELPDSLPQMAETPILLPQSTPPTSVVIPTFNGAMRLPHVLAALVAQTAPDRSFEVIVVDNASTDATSLVAREDPAVAQLGARGVAVRVIAEPRQGLTFARIAGVAAARSDAVCFLDDDNLPDPDYLENGIAAFADPSLGLAISRVRPRWETVPPPSVLRRRHLLAINDYLGDEPVDYGASATPAPTIGAGLWVRRSAFLKAVPWERPELLMPDRVGQRLVSGGDIELGVLIGKAGYRRIYAPTLRLVHEIPGRRFETSYLRSLIDGIVRSELTVCEKYDGARFGLHDHALAAAQLVKAVCAIPWLALTRDDVQREIAFVLADRWARLKGPLRSH
jgi:glycosyltransferase involved in cell wall biosynthesis